jgi:hypothetical protein
MIRFEMWDMDNGFFVEFEVPYSLDNLLGICSLKGSRNIRIPFGEWV